MRGSDGCLSSLISLAVGVLVAGLFVYAGLVLVILLAVVAAIAAVLHGAAWAARRRPSNS